MRIEVTYIEDPGPKKRFKLRAPKIRIAKPVTAMAAVAAAKPAKLAKPSKPTKPAKKPKPIKPPKALKPKPPKKPVKPPKSVKPAKPIKKKPAKPKKPTKPVFMDEPRRRLPRPLRNAVISAVVLLVLCIGIGEVYVMFTDNGSVPVAAASIQQTASASTGEIKPTKPAADIPESAAVEMATSPIAPGAPATVSVHTNPGSACSIAVVYKYDSQTARVPVNDPNLSPQAADDFGMVSWNWTIPEGAPLGAGRATVVCTYHTRHAMVIADLYITK
ncbi:MAG TPA: hypothetical protein VHD60_01275 [Candidatus Saccharimonadales bacterium]|nr:hypothetical protein [Candidatus Saccharimonadales bacterium]